MSHLPGLPVPNASDHPRRSTCPECQSGDLRHHDNAPHAKTFRFVRSTFCRRCWWNLDEPLIDDEAQQAAELASATAEAAYNTRETRKGSHGNA